MNYSLKKRRKLDKYWHAAVFNKLLFKFIHLTLLPCLPASNAEWFTGMAYGYGSMMTFDGAKYDTNQVGQFLLSRVTTATSQVLDTHIVRVGIERNKLFHTIFMCAYFTFIANEKAKEKSRRVNGREK